MSRQATTSVAAEPAWPESDKHADSVNRPWRAVVALVELILAAGASWAATWAWSHVVTHVTMRAEDGTALTSRIYDGPWTAAAIGFGLLAALLFVDLVRELMLAWRARSRE